MAEAVVSLLIEYLGSMAFDGIGEEIKLVKGVREDVENLKTNLEDIQAVLQDAEEKQLNDASVKRWLQKLKKASEEIENVLDDWSTEVLEYEIKKQGETDSSSSSDKKVCFPCFAFTKVDRLAIRRKIAHTIKQLNGELARISEDKNRYNFSINTVVERPRPLQTTFLVDQTKVHGRDEEKILLLRNLLSENCTDDDGGRSSLLIIPIVGLGGLGKTTLAQLAYNEEEVKTHFDIRVWVCVSDPFDEIKVAKAIAEGLTGSSTQSCELNAIIKLVHESIEGKRALIVLDDVWLEDYSRWEIFGEAFRNGGSGSRILVTTRKKEVAIMMGVARDQIIRLKELSEEHCWSIFSQLAFMGRRSEERRQLEPIGQKIAAKSRGLPLVAKTLGSLVRFKETASQWEDILGSQLWESNDAKVKDVFAPFLLSYYDLPPLEKRCFLYCAVFPQDHVIDKDELIEMWMSHGYLGRSVDSWKIGRDCFESLAMRSFFQDFGGEGYDKIRRYGGVHCKMHDIIHDFAHFLTGNEYIFMELHGDRENHKAMVKRKTRHLFFKESFPKSFGNAKNLRTLYILSGRVLYKPALLMVSQLTCLRSLSLRFCMFERLSEDIGLLKHLRYLDLSSNDILQELPKKLFNLCHLETLDLRGCCRLKTLPEGISKLVSLKHLYIRDCQSLKGLPKGLGKLCGLQRLDMIVVPEHRESYLDIGDLNSLKHLQFQGFLCITGCSNLNTTMDGAAKLDLSAKQHVLKLELEFIGIYNHNYMESDSEESDVSRIGEIKNDVEVLNSIHPPPNLRSLEIRNYLGLAISPAWTMPLSNLTRLQLSSFKNCETLRPLGKLPSLEYLRIAGFRKMCMVGEEFLGITEADREVVLFPKLEDLQFYYCWRWRDWEGCCKEATKIMPCLRTLSISVCNSLETLPEFLKTTPLQELSIWESEALKKQCGKEVGKEWNKISHVPNIIFNSSHVQKDGDWIQTDVTER